jgi:ribosomal-protein-alanine N-acetyltransferase
MSKNLVVLKPTTEDDLKMLFHFQLDAEANFMAAFTPEHPLDLEAYLAKYRPFLNDPTINNQTILLDGEIVGSIAKFEIEGEAEITYWIDRQMWGKGIGAEALRQFLELEKSRPLHARLAFDNRGSQKVLEKNGFLRIGTDTGYANARGKEIEEYIFRLE